MINPLVQTMRFGDQYPGLATAENPAPDLRTLDEADSARSIELGGNLGTNAMRPPMWFVAFAVLILILYFTHEG